MPKTVTNKTPEALKVPLPGGKALHLGPHQSGQISHHDADHPPLQEMIEAGQIEVRDEADNEAVPTFGRRRDMPFGR